MLQSPSKTSNNPELSYEDKKALPELLLKQQIAITDRGAVIRSFKELERNKRMNNGIINIADKAMFESELAGLFLDIKDMIKCKKSYKSMNQYERINYERLVKLVTGKTSFGLPELIQMMNYLLQMLHNLNLTNLLINERDPFEDWKTEM
jgi:hypothetical protein